MALYPVIMCGGSGTRLWPASRPSRPKQFIPLSGNRSLFQETVLRVLPMVQAPGRIIVVGGVVHRGLIVEQLEAIGVSAQILLEPEGRDSAPAMAAAAAWTLTQDRDGINVFVSSDHYVPDRAAFHSAITQAVGGAEAGRIVTLGIKPREPATAYGYIAPSGPGLSEVRQFIEKPDQAAAQSLVNAGYLWNAGIFICRADILKAEFDACESTVWPLVERSLKGVGHHTLAVLGSAFSKAPKISIDYAVMENTQKASVLEVDFRWSDLGSWDALAARGDGEYGTHIFEDAEGCMVRAPEGTLVAALGVRNLGIIVENDAVLVCDLSRAQEVKKIVERVKLLSPQHLDFKKAETPSLQDSGKRFFEWMKLRALPVWHSMGQDEDGVFAEALTLSGEQTTLTHRLRVQTRQIYCFAEAGALGWAGRWRSTLESGVEALERFYHKGGADWLPAIHCDRSPVLGETLVYDQAFVLFALAAAARHDVAAERSRAQAKSLLDHLRQNRLPQGGLRESGAHPFQSNAHMHLLEASLAWAEVDDDPRWLDFADEIVALAMAYFIDGETGCLREFFDEQWKPAAGDAGRIIEPGHQFEWMWLLSRYAQFRDRTDITSVALRLYSWGQRGYWDPASVMVDTLNEDGSARVRRARLWPQAEWLRAALLMAEMAPRSERKTYLDDANSALQGLNLYLTDRGLWRDKRVSNLSFIDEPAPATSLYHIMGACNQLAKTDKALRLGILSNGVATALS